MSDPDFAEIDEIRLALGDLCIAWAHLEEDYFSLVMSQFEEWDLDAYDALRNELDIRQMTRFLKGIALSRQSNPISQHIVNLSDRVDNDLRSARNRYIHDPIYRVGPSFVRNENVTRIKRPQSRKVDIKFSHSRPIRKTEIELLVRCINLASVYLGSIGRICDGEETDYAELEHSSDALDSAIAEYTALTKSSG